MTAHILTTELGFIIQESKKLSDIKHAAEKSLQELKDLPFTSEAQLAADLQRRPHFVQPFLLACRSRHAKLVTSSVSCLQRLVSSGGFPKERLKEILDAFQDCSATGVDVQLKILQSLPAILQNYATPLEDDLQAKLLEICNRLQQVKTSAVSSTASATLQQLISSVFEKVEAEDDRTLEVPTTVDISLEGGSVSIRAAAHDAYRVLEDLCLLTEGQKSVFVRNASLSPAFGMELIEAILINHAELFASHTELAHLLRYRIMPLITRFLSERLTYAVTVRTIRIFCILLREYLDIVQTECEIPLSLLNHTLDSETAVPWRRAVCMEAFRVIYSTPNLAVNIYSLFDNKDKKRGILQDNLATFVRIAAEKPALIGISQHSSFPVGRSSAQTASQEQAVLEAVNVAGIISGDSGATRVDSPGISTQWSSMRTPCLDQLDKFDAPYIPETYVYSLVLTCINNLSEGLAKVVLAVTLHDINKVDNRDEADRAADTKGEQGFLGKDLINQEDQDGVHSPPLRHKRRTRSLLVNPLALESDPAYPAIKTAAKMVDECWPAVLATSSTFLYAALDADFYRSLIRSIQKFTQVAGVLRLSTPRDAFLTTLAKAAVPQNVLKSDTFSSPASALESPRLGSNPRGFASVDSLLTQSSVDAPNKSRRNSVDITRASLTQRNLMCLRALVNVGIAIGPILRSAWTIILDTLQKADTILTALASVHTARDYRSDGQNAEHIMNDPPMAHTTISSEIMAVEVAIARLLESTSMYSNVSFVDLLQALCVTLTDEQHEKAATAIRDASTPQRRTPSFSGVPTAALIYSQQSRFTIAKLGELARINLLRLTHDALDGGWQVLMDYLHVVATSPQQEGSTRLMAADVLGSVAVETTISSISGTGELRREVQQRSLSALEYEVLALHKKSLSPGEHNSSTDVEIHRSVLEALRVILEQCGDSLIAGWPTIFAVINSIFRPSDKQPVDAASISDTEQANTYQPPRVISPKLIKSGFSSVQLICSDFLSSVPQSTITSLMDILSRFCSQRDDLNISLTTITLFWNVSDFLHDNTDHFSFDPNSVIPSTNASLTNSLPVSAVDGSITMLWITLQQRMASITDDNMADVRNGILHTIFRIVEICGAELSPSLWQLYIERVTFWIISINIKNYVKYGSLTQNSNSDTVKSLIGSSEIILKGLAKLIGTNLDILVQISTFEIVWQDLIDYFASYFDLGSQDIYALTFTAIAQLVSSAGINTKLSRKSVDAVVSLWACNAPETLAAGREDFTVSESALVAYVDSVTGIYRLIEFRVEVSQLKLIMKTLRQCLDLSTAKAYSSDLENLTKLQTQVMQCFEMLRTDLPGIPSTIISHVAEFVVLPYKQSIDHRKERGLTFVAYSKCAIELLQALVIKHIHREEIFVVGSVIHALAALAQSINLKYKWHIQGKEPLIWREATSAALVILERALPAMRSLNVRPDCMLDIWTEVVNLAMGIGYVDRGTLPPNHILLSDETFDLAALARLHHVVISLLYDYSTPSSILDDYVRALFQTSLIHPMETWMVNPPDIVPILKDLYKTRSGRTHNPPFHPRVRISYFCFQELFSLVSLARHYPDRHQTRTLEEGTIAHVAFPYLILRCALPLKTYIADQPLRGHMPTPMSQRLELLFVLKSLTELQCDTGAAVGLVTSEEDERVKGLRISDPSKKHLEWLAPLLYRALAQASRDEELSKALRSVLDACIM